MDSPEVLETLKAANSYLNRLKLLDKEFEMAVSQIMYTLHETVKNIKETFSNLQENLENILNQREKYLIDSANMAKMQGLSPLEECRKIISNNIESTNKLINMGNSLINGANGDMAMFANSASLLGNLPEVPELKEVPYISFCYGSSAESEVKDILSNLGHVCRIAPVQVTEFKEKPGSIYIEWKNIDSEDRLTDIQEFRLQRAFGDVTKEKHLLANFKDCYRGLDTEYLLKDLQTFQPYSFRVCCKFDGSTEWSPWSLPQVFSTTVKPYCWKANDDYVLSDQHKIAAPCKDNANILCSDGPQFSTGHSVEFTFLEIDTSGDAILGLVIEDVKKCASLKLVKENSFFINHQGKIFINGCEKLTVLPKFTKGLKVCITCESTNDQKVRVSIDSDDKRVTYDWAISPNCKMYFTSQLATKKWKVMVE